VLLVTSFLGRTAMSSSDWRRAGTRVRLVRPDIIENTGATGVISQIIPLEHPAPDVWPDWYINCIVKWDSPILLLNISGNMHKKSISCTHTDRLEPIIDDGRKVIAWADMQELWTPEKILEPIQGT
jgi:hypothetical protein